MKKSKQKSVTIDDLAVMVAKGFDNLQKEFKADIARVETRMTGLENRMTSLENRMTSLENRVTDFETRMTTSMVDLEDRLSAQTGGLEKIIEKHVLSKPLTKSEFHILDARVTRLEEKIG